ncbi:unnamed protein product, partial [Didymodactylos carnosus]
KRLKRITTVSLRNLTLNEFDFFVHFTLHRADNTIAFYTSECMENERNPEWTNLIFPKSVQCLQDFIMRVWVTSKNRKLNNNIYNPIKRLFIEYQIYLNDLKPDTDVRGKDYDRINSLCLEMFGYSFGDNDETNELEQNSNFKIPNSLLRYLHKSYTRESIYRIINVINAIQNEKDLSKICLHNLQKYITPNQIYSEAIKERETRQLKVKCLKHHSNIQKYHLDIQKYLQNNKRTKVDERKIQLEKNFTLLHEQQEDLILIDKNIEQSKSILRELKQLVIYRQNEIVNDIARYVYPISINSMHEYCIAGLKLPQAEDKILQSTYGRERDNDAISIAINYCCHFVLIISQFVQLPLRFPIEYNSSISKIFDYTLSSSEKTIEFPLYIHNDLNAFHYGFFLLNRNIGQMMYHCRTIGRNTDYRKTLENLKDLIDHHFSLSNNFKYISKMSLSSSDMNTSKLDTAQRQQIMSTVQQQLAIQNAQELLQKLSDKCFKMCISKPGGSLSNPEQKCISLCMDRYMDAWNIVSRTYAERIKREQNRM